MSALESYKSFVPVASAKAVSNTQVGVAFANGEKDMIDFSDLIGKGPWKRLANPASQLFPRSIRHRRLD